MKQLIVLLVALSLTACATSGTSSYGYQQPSSDHSIKNTVTVDQPFEAVWDTLVERMATGFFVINNIDKASRLINLSFSTDTPELYVDCGRTTRYFDFKDQNEVYDYAVASDSVYKATGKWGPYKNLTAVYEVSRNTSLEGRINVYVAPIDSERTKVSVNTKYIFTGSTSGVATGYNAFGSQSSQERIPGSNETVSFTTQEEKETQFGSNATVDPVVCRATGNLEESILEKARP